MVFQKKIKLFHVLNSAVGLTTGLQGAVDCVTSPKPPKKKKKKIIGARGSLNLNSGEQRRWVVLCLWPNYKPLYLQQS